MVSLVQSSVLMHTNAPVDPQVRVAHICGLTQWVTVGSGVSEGVCVSLCW